MKRIRGVVAALVLLVGGAFLVAGLCVVIAAFWVNGDKHPALRAGELVEGLLR